MFDRIAGRYDLLNRLLSFGLDGGWRRRTVSALVLPPDARVLDIATGTGDLAREILVAVPGARVIGLDPAPEMLSIATRKLAAAGLGDRVEFRQGTAEELPFPDASFDGVAIAFGIRNVPDVPAALAEMARVTRPAGRIAILELLEPDHGPLASLARIHVRHLVPRMGALISSPAAYRYLQESIRRFPPLGVFAAEMERSGLRVMSARRLSFGAVGLFVAAPGISPS
jgi:demethylmenaquinone methyltransferase/2-methoxy-6-polyprenyl-1,4-benzoquinol methylase